MLHVKLNHIRKHKYRASTGNSPEPQDRIVPTDLDEALAMDLGRLIGDKPNRARRQSEEGTDLD